jgi:hypothetical protein
MSDATTEHLCISWQGFPSWNMQMDGLRKEKVKVPIDNNQRS